MIGGVGGLQGRLLPLRMHQGVFSFSLRHLGGAFVLSVGGGYVWLAPKESIWGLVFVGVLLLLVCWLPTPCSRDEWFFLTGVLPEWIP